MVTGCWTGDLDAELISSGERDQTGVTGRASIRPNVTPSFGDNLYGGLISTSSIPFSFGFLFPISIRSTSDQISNVLFSFFLFNTWMIDFSAVLIN